MHKTRLIFILLNTFFLLFSPISHSQDTDWQDGYESIDFQDALIRCERIMGQEALECEKTCYNFCGLFDLKFETEFSYLDSISELQATKLNFINLFIKTYLDSSYSEMFQHEILFSNNGNKYHFAVQEPTLESYREELKKDDAVYLYIMYLGTVVENNVVEHMFVANDFLKKENSY